MSRRPQTPMDYKHQQLMDELNEFMIAAKVHLRPWELGLSGADKARYSKPTIEQMDSLHNRLQKILQQDAT